MYGPDLWSLVSRAIGRDALYPLSENEPMPVCVGCGYKTWALREEDGRMLCRKCCQQAGWEDIDLYCPFCGHHGVQVEEGDGDYYVGSTHRCKECREEFHLP